MNFDNIIKNVLLNKVIKEQVQQPIQQGNQLPNNNQLPIKKTKAKLVKFDTKTETPFQVLFTERGFLVNDTRFSFEEIETAISKKYNIILDQGNGLTLDAVRMQKILKYKDY